jgi:hypothetical protein
MARKKPRLGKLPPRYSFILNPYTDVRLSKCPKCKKLTFNRKFPLFIHIEGWGPLVLGLTCRYCNRCELIMAHKDILEGELALTFSRLEPNVIGNEYLVLGTMEKKAWQKGMTAPGQNLGEALDHVAQFKKMLDLHVEGGWMPADKVKKSRPRSRSK